jgi:hypothetical protein
VITAASLHQFPRADHPQATLSGFDLDGDGADIRDSADVPALLAPCRRCGTPYFSSSDDGGASAVAGTVAASATWLSLSEVDSGNSQFDAGMPGQLAPSVVPIDFVPNGVRVDDCPDAAPVVGAQQHGIADNRMQLASLQQSRVMTYAIPIVALC